MEFLEFIGRERKHKISRPTYVILKMIPVFIK